MLKSIQWLLERGANPNIPNSYGHFPLHYAAAGDSCCYDCAQHRAMDGDVCTCTEMISLLIKYGANPNICDAEGATPLHWAADASDDDTCEAIECLLNSGANLDQADNKSRTALYRATDNEDEVVVRLLLARGADVAQFEQACKESPWNQWIREQSL